MTYNTLPRSGTAVERHCFTVFHRIKGQSPRDKTAGLHEERATREKEFLYRCENNDEQSSLTSKVETLTARRAKNNSNRTDGDG